MSVQGMQQGRIVINGWMDGVPQSEALDVRGVYPEPPQLVSQYAAFGNNHRKGTTSLGCGPKPATDSGQVIRVRHIRCNFRKHVIRKQSLRHWCFPFHKQCMLTSGSCSFHDSGGQQTTFCFGLHETNFSLFLLVHIIRVHLIGLCVQPN